MNAIKRLEKKKRSADRSRYSEDRDCCRLGGALDSFDYGRFDRRGEAVQIRRDSWRAEGLAGSQGPSPEPPRFDCNRAMMPRVAPSFHAENTQNVFIEGCPASSYRVSRKIRKLVVQTYTIMATTVRNYFYFIASQHLSISFHHTLREDYYFFLQKEQRIALKAFLKN